MRREEEQRKRHREKKIKERKREREREREKRIKQKCMQGILKKGFQTKYKIQKQKRKTNESNPIPYC
jgi:hypothetical protein